MLPYFSELSRKKKRANIGTAVFGAGAFALGTVSVIEMTKELENHDTDKSSGSMFGAVGSFGLAIGAQVFLTPSEDDYNMFVNQFNIFSPESKLKIY